MNTTAEKDDHEEILREANDRFTQIQSDDKDNRDNYRADTLFVYSPGNQWPDDVRATRKAWKELCLEFNQLKQFAAQVVNDQRQNRPGIKVHPAGGGASDEVAKILQGLIRGIENESRAEAVYDSAFQSGVVGGRGWWRVVSEYDGEGFDQRLCIKPIQDSLNVYADLNYQQPDGSDRSFVFVTDRYTKTEFRRKWPDAEEVSWDAMDAVWGSSEDIIVADYYRRVCKTRTLVLMSDGAKGYKDDMPENLPFGISIVKEREVEDYSVEWYTLAGGQQVLAKYDWPGSVIPVVCVPGEDMILDGKRVYQGLTRHARDAQSMLNFGMTQQAIHLSLTPRAPWVMAEGQNEGYENMWRNANTKNFGALIYKPVTLDGMAVPPPERTMPAIVSQGWDAWCQMMIGMIKSTIGMYEQSLGQKGNEVSGRAITAREKQGDTATFNFVDNLSRAIALTGRILVEAIPVFYDTERIVHIINPDDTRKAVTINQATPNADNPLQAIKMNDVTEGTYAVICEAGPSYATKRQETSDALMHLVQAFPPAAQVAGDLIVKSLDVADAEVIAERMKLMLPPNILQAEAAKNEGKMPPDPQVMAQMQQQQQQLEQAAQTMEAMQNRIQELENDASQKMMAIESSAREKESAALLDAEVTIKKARLDAETKIAVAEIGAQTDMAIASMGKADVEAEDNGKFEDLANLQMELIGKIDQFHGDVIRPPTIEIVRDEYGQVIGRNFNGVYQPAKIDQDGRIIGV